MSSVPVCSCRAGPCRIFTETNGPNAGHSLFVCNITKGQGACSFSQPLDALAMTASGCVDGDNSSLRSVLTSCGDTSTPTKDLIGSPAVNTPHCPENFGSVKRSKEMLVQLERQEDASKELFQKHTKRLRHGIPNMDGEVPLEEQFQISSLISNVEIHFTRKQMSDAEITSPAFSASPSSCFSALSRNIVPELVNGATNQNIGLQVHDWWGRLAYPPSRCLINPSPKPFFCCIFPSFDPVIASRNVKRVSIETSAIPSETPLSLISQDAHPSSLMLWEPSSLEINSRTDQGNVMNTAISEWFAQLAMHIQNELHSLLESMSFRDHLSMVQEATNTFTALEQLNVDFQSFRLKVKEYIDRERLLDEIESSICNDGLYHECIDKRNHEEIHLDKLSSDEAKAKADFEVTSKQVHSLEEEDYCLREMLIRVETELLCCQAEKRKREFVYSEISKERIESEQRLEVASIAAVEVVEARRRKEEERDAAKAAFEKAQILLRQ